MTRQEWISQLIFSSPRSLSPQRYQNRGACNPIQFPRVSYIVGQFRRREGNQRDIRNWSPQGLKDYKNDTDDQNINKTKKERKYPTQLLQSKNLIQDHLKLQKYNADYVRRVVSQRDVWFSRELGYSLCTHVQKPSKAWFFRYRYLWVNNPWVESYFRGNPRSRPLQRKYIKMFSKKTRQFL